MKPQDVILSLTMTAGAALRSRRSPSLLGVALRFEGWALDDENMTPGQRSRAAAGRLTRPSLEPNRIEARVIHAVDTAGTAYRIQQLRGGKQQTFTCPPGGEAAVLGEVPEALRFLLHAMTGRQQHQEPGR